MAAVASSSHGGVYMVPHPRRSFKAPIVCTLEIGKAAKT
jgi:hypothetical protein